MKDARTLQGLDQLLELAPDGARLSWLSKGNISKLYDDAAAAGRAANSVRRSLHRAATELLRNRVGQVGAPQRFEGVTAPGDADDRLVRVTSDEIARLPEHCLYDTRRVVTLPILRVKDLRHLLPRTLAALGADRREIQAILGHAPGSRQTDRYVTPGGRSDGEGRRSAGARDITRAYR